MKRKCILLVRVSTTAKKQELSLDEQTNDLYELAKRYGYKDKDCICIAKQESGRKRFYAKSEDAKDLQEIDRQGLREMKDMINNDKSIDCVFAWEISRISRRKKVLFDIQEFLVDRGIQLIIKTPQLELLNADKTLNNNADLAFTLFSQFAESEMNLKLARWKRTKDVKRSEGVYTGGFVLYGYRVDAETKKLIIHEEEAENVREMYSMYLSGEHSYNTIAAEFKKRGVWESLNAARKAVGKILKNTSYAGRPSAENDKTLRTEGNIYPPIISLEMIERCKAINEANPKTFKKKHTELFYGKGILRCPVCGGIMRVRKDYLTYTCQNAECENHNYFQANLIDWVLWMQGINCYAFNWQNTSKDDVAALKKTLKRISRSIEAKEKQKEEINASILKTEERLILRKIKEADAERLEDGFHKQYEEAEKDIQRLLTEKIETEKNIKALENDECMNLNQLQMITDNEKRHEIIKDNISRAVIERHDKQIAKLSIYIKPKFDFEYKDYPYVYYLNTKSNIVYDGNYNIELAETDAANQACIVRKGKVTIHEHKEGSHQSKEYQRMKNKEYRESHKAERAAYAREWRAKQKALKNTNN